MKEATGLEPEGGKNKANIQGLIEEYNRVKAAGAHDSILYEIQDEIKDAKGLIKDPDKYYKRRQYFILSKINQEYQRQQGRTYSNEGMHVNIGKLLVDIVLGDNKDLSIKRHPISGFIKRPIDYVARKIQLLKEKRALLRGSKEQEESNSKRL